MSARILDAVAGFIGEFAEIDLLGVARLSQHVDVGSRAEHALLAARQNHDPHLGMLEADAVERVVEFYIYPEIVRLELQPVAWGRSGFLRHIQGQCGDRPGAGQAPVAISLGFAVEGDHRKFNAYFICGFSLTSTLTCIIFHLYGAQPATWRLDRLDPLDAFRFV